LGEVVTEPTVCLATIVFVAGGASRDNLPAYRPSK
jgi:hypothetical protein